MPTRIRRNVSRTSKGLVSWDCTVETTTPEGLDTEDGGSLSEYNRVLLKDVVAQMERDYGALIREPS